MNVAIIGKGNVGSALARGLSHGDHEVQSVGNEPERVRQIAEVAEVIILAVPFGALDATVAELGEAVDGKTVVDATNAIGKDGNLVLGFSTSGAEELQKKMPSARVVKALNTVFARHMDTGKVDGAPLTVLIAGDDVDAKRKVVDLARSIGFDAVDAGPLRTARLLEPLAMLTIQLGYGLGMGTDIGFRLVRGG